MRLKTVVAAVLAGALAPFARGAVTVTSPADYATVETHGSHLKAFEALTQAQRESTSYLGAINTTWRKDAEAAYNVNSLPITLSWSGTSGSTTVKVTCNKTGKVVFEKTTTAKTVEMQNYEIGRNYTWTISNTAGNATGHFYVGRSAPRIIPLDLCHASAARDCGGWKAESGKVVKQGKVFRTAAFDWVYDEATMLAEFKDYWNNVVGLKTEIDLREEKYWKLFKETYGWEGSTFGPSVRLWCSQTELGTSYKSGSYKSAITDANMRTAMKGALLLFADAANYPILFHCSQGRDRTGTLAFVLNGMLGVSLDDLYLDYDYTDYSKDEYPGPTASNGWITKLYNQLKTSYPDASYPTLQSKCVAYAKKCGLTDDNIASIKANLLEAAETAAGSSEEPTLMEEHDEVTYRPYWWFRDAGGGTWTSSGGYFYTDETATKKCKDVYGSADGVRYPDAYDALVVMKPNAKYPYCGPSCAAYKIGKLITNGTGGEVALGNPKFTFQNQSVSTRTLWRHEAGHAAAGNTDLTLDGTGTGSIDLYKGAIIDASDLVAKTPNTIFLKFAPKSDGAGMTVVPHSSNKLPTTKLGWFEGGSATDTQRFEVSNAWLRFANASKTCQVAGALDFNFILGPSNKTTTAFAPFGVSGSLVINAGSRLTVDAGEKSAGTYPLITVGSGKTLTCDASLCSNATVTGLKSGTTGAVVKSGNQINLVIANASGKTVVTVPAISATSATYTGAVQKPTFSPSSSNYTVNYGSGDYKAVGTYTITLTLVNTTSYVWGDGTTAAKTYSYEIKSGSDPGPEPGPTPDTKPVTYTWKGGTGLWSESANWTPGTGATYGIPDNATYATADFPATLTAATTCTLASDAAVKYALFNAPNLTLVLDNATLTCNDRIDMITWGAFNFGNTKTGNSTIEFKGARAAMVTTLTSVRANFGYLGDDTASGTCTMRFVVPATGWETTAPIRTGADSKVVIQPNVKLAVNATALGVPAEGVTKTVLLASSTDGMFYSGTATVTCANGASGEVVVEGNDLVLQVTGGGPVQPEPEPTPSAKFDAAHTIICYGDSLTWGTAAAETTMDDRENFFEGRLAGVAEMPQGYPWWLSGMIPSNYNVIHQARPGAQTCNITSWSGEQTVKVKTAFTLPAVGSVSLCKNLVFGSDCSYGEQGGWAKGEPDDQDVQDRWYGFVTPIFSLYEPYDATKTRYSITGTLGGRHVRLQGLHPTNVTVTVFGEGTEAAVAVGSEFVPDNELVSPYKDAIRVICTGANDGDKNYAAEIKPHLVAFAAKGGRYLIVSPSVNTGSASGTNATATENDMATTFGENYLNLRLKMVTEGKARAAALGVPFTGNWDATDGTGLKAVGDSTHFSEKGYKVMADFIREKLVALGYVSTDEPPPHVHDWSAWSRQEPTKTADGLATRTCACGETEERVLPKLWDYLETDSSGYLGTGYVPNLKKTEVAFDVRFPDGTSTSGGNALCCANAYVAYLFGERTDWPSDYENALNLSLDPTKLDYYNCPRLVDPTAACGPAIPAITDTESRHAISFCGNQAVVDGTTYTGENAATDALASSSLMLFAAKQAVKSQTNYGKMRKFVYGVTIKENGEFVRRYRPALDANGKATLFDDETLTYAPAFAADGFKAVNESVTPDPDRALKVLAIGNSFSLSLTYESGLPWIAQDLGKKLDFFNLYYGGCSLQQHWEHHDKVNFYQQFNDNFVTTPNGVSGLAPATASLDDVLAAEPWDIVTLQQNSANSGDGDTYEPYFGHLVNLIRTKAPTAKIWIHQTWSRQGDKLETSKKTYADYDEMYDDICANYQAMATKYGIDTIIPVGYAVQLARHEQDYDPLASDNQHLANPAGSYMQSCVWAAKLFGLDVTAVTRKPSSVDATTAAMLRAVAQKAAVATDLTNYGATADRKCAAYTWKGGDGLWEQAASWTPDAYGTYGIPHAKTAQAVFPASLTEPTVCTVAEDHTVSNLVFDSSNLTLRLDDAKLTVVDSLHDGTYGAYNFGLSGAGDTKLVIAGAKAGLVAAHSGVRASIGSQTDGSTGVCTVRFEVPATGWETEAPLQASGYDSNVRFKSNVRFEIDATALDVPAEGETNEVTLASCTDGVRFDGAEGTSTEENFAALVERSSFVFASGATGELLLDGNYLKLLVTKGETPVPPAPTEVTTNAMANASWGYEIRGLGTAGNEVALVYTNASETMAWTPDRDMTDVRFLVVAGGGGGGAFTAGGGGGGGGVVTGYIHAVTANDPITITVGAGGTGGLANGNKGTVGGDSTLGAYVTAYGGGYGAGKAAGGTGGSGGGGSGSSTTTYKGGAAKAAVIDSVAVTAVGFGCNGGTNNTTTATDGAGGGGALTPGNTPTAKNPGAGGEGLASDISGESVVYGSGGGGGSNNTYCNSNAGKGGTNAGNGVRNKTVDNRDAVANCGGGGGGGGYNSGAYAGGNGGSGVVVIRYVDPGVQPEEPKLKPGEKGGATVDLKATNRDEAEAEAAKIKICSPDTTIVSDADYAAYFTKTVAEVGGVWTVTAELDPVAVAPEIVADEDTPAVAVVDGTLKVNVKVLPGLYYGVKAADTLEALKNAVVPKFEQATEDGSLQLSASQPEQGATSQFCVVVVSATDGD